MTHSVSGREARSLGASGPSGHALDLVRSALDVAELLVQHVIRPAQQQANPPDFTKEVGEVAMLLRLADRVLVGEADQARIAVLAWRISRVARSRSTRAAVAARPSRAALRLHLLTPATPTTPPPPSRHSSEALCGRFWGTWGNSFGVK